jgi:hypothetical protein
MAMTSIRHLRPARRVAVIATSLATLTCAFFAVTAVRAPAAYASCSGGNYYGRATSGLGSNKGTGARILTWTHWSVPGESGGNFSDEAVWAVYQANTNSTNALEAGFFSGWGNGNYGGGSGYTNGMIPYFTLGNGAQEYDDWGAFLPTNTWIWMSATSDGTHSWAYVNSKSIASPINYGVAFPHWNLAQGETNATNVTMGGSAGEQMYLYYQTPSNSWYNWGFLNECVDSPYWVATNGTDFFENGGG